MVGTHATHRVTNHERQRAPQLSGKLLLQRGGELGVLAYETDVGQAGCGANGTRVAFEQGHELERADSSRLDTVGRGRRDEHDEHGDECDRHHLHVRPVAATRADSQSGELDSDAITRVVRAMCGCECHIDVCQ